MTTAIDPVLSGAGGATPLQKATQNLGQQDFLRLLTTQLQNQDPMEPMDNGEFLGQMAQFSTVSGIQDMQASMSQLAASLQSNQTLQAASLIGHDVIVPSSVGILTDDGLKGRADMPAGGQLVVDIVDGSGQVVQQLDMGTQPGGLTEFTWDGRLANGEMATPGAYGIQARMLQNNTSVALQTYASSRVNSVDMSRDGLTLDVQGLGAVQLNQVLQITG